MEIYFETCDLFHSMIFSFKKFLLQKTILIQTVD